MLDVVFGGLIVLALLWGIVRDGGNAVTAAMLSAAEEAVSSAIALAGGFAFFGGWMGVLRRAGAMEWLAMKLRRVLRRLFGGSLPEEAMPYVAMNLAANMLGMGNAATPMGIEAAKRMADGGIRASNALCLFLVLNSSSVQLLPSTVIALRAAAGSQQPGAVVGPALAATVISTLVGAAACKLMEKRA